MPGATGRAPVAGGASGTATAGSPGPTPAPCPRGHPSMTGIADAAGSTGCAGRLLVRSVAPGEPSLSGVPGGRSAMGPTVVVPAYCVPDGLLSWGGAGCRSAVGSTGVVLVSCVGDGLSSWGGADCLSAAGPTAVLPASGGASVGSSPCAGAGGPVAVPLAAVPFPDGVPDSSPPTAGTTWGAPGAVSPAWRVSAGRSVDRCSAGCVVVGSRSQAKAASTPKAVWARRTAMCDVAPRARLLLRRDVTLGSVWPDSRGRERGAAEWGRRGPAPTA